MSFRKRCPTTMKWANIPATTAAPAKIVRSVCDRPELPRHDTHRGRLLLGGWIIGILEWAR